MSFTYSARRWNSGRIDGCTSICESSYRKPRFWLDSLTPSPHPTPPVRVWPCCRGNHGMIRHREGDGTGSLPVGRGDMQSAGRRCGHVQMFGSQREREGIHEFVIPGSLHCEHFNPIAHHLEAYDSPSIRFPLVLRGCGHHTETHLHSVHRVHTLQSRTIHHVRVHGVGSVPLSSPPSHK